MATPVNTSGALFRPGDTVGRYRIESLHGIPREQEIWISYRVKNQDDGKTYLLKTLSAEVSLEKAFVDRIRLEAKLLKTLSHPNIVGLVESIEGPDECHLVLEFVEGETLQAWVDFQTHSDRARTKKVMRIVEPILNGFAHIHQTGVVHRDLKPAHIILAKDGEVKITGFGLSGVAVGPGDTESEDPNLPSRKPHADIFSAGVMIYYMLTGNIPSGLSNPASQLVPGLAPQWDEFIGSCIAETPEKRYQDGAAALAAFRQLEAQTDHGSKRSWTTKILDRFRLG